MNVLWLCRNILHSLLSSFSAHSTKGAATSKAWAASVNVDTILAKVGWARESTFEKFYRRDTEGPSVESPANRQGIVRTSWNPQSKFQKSIHIHRKAFTFTEKHSHRKSSSAPKHSLAILTCPCWWILLKSSLEDLCLGCLNFEFFEHSIFPSQAVMFFHPSCDLLPAACSLEQGSQN